MASEKGSHFFNFSSLDKNRSNGYCKLCHKNYKDRNGGYSNFIKHLKRIHPLEYERISSSDSACLSEETNVVTDDRGTTDTTTNKSRQNEFALSITKNFIIKCGLPLNIVEHAGFRDFLKDCHLKYEPVSSKKLKNAVIPSLKSNVLKKIHETINNTYDLTLTIDVWSDRRCRSYLGITYHVIDEKMVPQAYLIDFTRFKSPHTGENILHLTEDVLNRFNTKEKVFKIITDNASSMVKAYKFGLFADEEHGVLEYQTDPTSSTNSPSDNYDDDIQLDNFEVIDVKYPNNVEDYQGLPTYRLSCFLHSLQLCVRDGIQNATQISKVLNKCRMLSKVSHKSNKMADLLDQLNESISKTNVTRWNSEYMLIKSILSIGENDLDSIVTLMENPFKFSNNDIMTLQEILDILESFFDISIKCQSEKLVTASLVVPAVVHLMVHLRDIKEQIVFSNKLVQQLELSIEKRFAGIINRINQVKIEDNDQFNDPVYFIAAVLDSSFKFLWLRDLKLTANTENRLKHDVIQLILDEINKNFKVSPTKVLDEGTFSTSKPKKKKIFVYDDSYNDNANDSIIMNPVTELEAYLNDPIKANFSEYWCRSQMKQLKKLAVRVASVQASSAPIERVFSCTGLIMSSRCTGLSEQLFKDLVFLKANQALL
ncbi:unnamed protein product [Rotaria magnacalcarata]|uniref:BED-type domain-containing protein n=3 Tax=Rotaria magnacalcarata TaxID=392030 RepID=A0A816MUM3_9BILA|nr:unnamed protein product [Rotaria magnacalcarata]